MLVRRFAQHAQALFAEPLEAVRRAARLERAAAEDLGAGLLHRRGGREDLLFGLRRARAGHHDDLVAADPHVVDDDDGAFGLEGAARELVRLGDAKHLVHAVHHRNQRRIHFVRADDAEHGAIDARGPVHVHARLDQRRDDFFDLRLGCPLFHYHHHGYRSSPFRLAPPSVSRRRVIMSRGALDAPRLVDDPFEHPYDGVAFERTARVLAVGAHVVQHLLLTVGLVHLEPERLFQLPDFERAMGALAEQLDQPLIELIDPLPELVDCHEYLRRLFSQRT